MSEEEKELVNNCKLWVTEEDINYTRWFGLDDLSVLVNLIEKQQKEIEKVGDYIQQEIWLCEHDIEACCDDEQDAKQYYKDRKEIFEEIKNKILEIKCLY